MRAKVGLLVGLLVFLCTASPAYSYQADVELIPQGRYVEVALREIQQAKGAEEDGSVRGGAPFA